MLAQRIALRVSHEGPLRDVVKEFMISRMDANNLVRQVTVTPGRGVILRLERRAVRACDARLHHWKSPGYCCGSGISPLLRIQDMLWSTLSGLAAAARWPPLVTRAARL